MDIGRIQLRGNPHGRGGLYPTKKGKMGNGFFDIGMGFPLIYLYEAMGACDSGGKRPPGGGMGIQYGYYGYIIRIQGIYYSGVTPRGRWGYPLGGRILARGRRSSHISWIGLVVPSVR